MRRDSVHRRAHGKLAHAEEDVAPGWILVEVGPRLEDRLGRRGQVRGPAEELRHDLRDGVHHRAAGRARGLRLAGRKARQRGLPASLEHAPLGALKLRRELRKRRCVARKQRPPLRLKLRAVGDRRAPIRQRGVGHLKALILGEAKKPLRRRHAFRTQRLAMRLARPGPGTAVADHCSHRNKRRPAGLRLGRLNSPLQRRQIIAVRHALHVPVVGLEALQGVFGIT